MSGVLTVAANESTIARVDLVVSTRRWDWRTGEFVWFSRIVRHGARLGGQNVTLAQVTVRPGAPVTAVDVQDVVLLKMGRRLLRRLPGLFLSRLAGWFRRTALRRS